MTYALILTALIDTQPFSTFERLRRVHYPPERNIVPAHLTLFHHLPGTEADAIVRRLKAEARGTPVFSARVAGLRNLGQGVAFRIESPELEDVRAGLADAFGFWLIPLDRQRFSPHITIQNKVEPREAKALYKLLSSTFSPWSFSVKGLTLWRYLGGPWEKLRDFRFR